MINKITVHYPLHAACVDHWTGNHSGNSPLGCIQLTYIKSIDMQNKNTPGVKKTRPSRKHKLALINTLD